MTTFILRRFVLAILSILLTTLALYSYFMYVGPNSVFGQYDKLLAQIAKPEEPAFNEFTMPGSYKSDPRAFYLDSAKSFQEIYKVDQPWPLNFVLWLFDPQATTWMDRDGTLKPQGIHIDLLGLKVAGSGLLTGDFGTSTVIYKRSLGSLLTDAWSNTLLLVGTSLAFALLLAIPVGVISAVNQDSPLDTGLTFVTFMGLSIPPFMLAFVLSALFGILPYNIRQQSGWDWFPMLQPGYVFSVDQEGNWVNRIYHMILPVATLALAQGALFTRHVRSSMLEVLRQEYIRTAIAKGATMRRVVMKHALRNALVPIITVVSLSLPAVISGSMIIEQVFSYPGMGLLFFNSARGCGSAGASLTAYCPPFSYLPDLTVTLGLIVIMVAVVALSSMMADILYVAADPRISFGRQGK